jgi:putative restriction endonuclease
LAGSDLLLYPSELVMRYWWVNQNQTFRQEFAGGYLWSPKRNANGAKNPFYESMREVAPGDLIISFVDTLLVAIGIALSYCFEAPKPTEFGMTGSNWENIGWKIEINFTPLLHKVRPKDHMDVLRKVLPVKYSPLQASGNGLQGIYLTELTADFAHVLFGLIGPEVTAISVGATLGRNDVVISTVPDEIERWERKIEGEVATDASIPETEKQALVSSRRGQGLFKRRVMSLEDHCRITKVDNPVHLIASHCKPWRDASNEERLNGENGLLLTPSIDHLFDRGFLGFEDNGALIISPVAHRPSLNRMGVITKHKINVGGFTAGQKTYLDFHRNYVLLQAHIRK